MNKSYLVRGARQLLTLHGPPPPRRGASMRHLGLIEDGSVLIADGLITHVGPTRRIENLAEARSAEEISAHGRVVMPGFTDSHTHVIAAGGRAVDYVSYTQPAGNSESPLHPSVAEACMDYVRYSAGRALELQARRIVYGMLRHGTTTVEIKAGYGLNESSDLKTLRTVKQLKKCANTVGTFMHTWLEPPEYRHRLAEYTEFISSAFLSKIREKQLAQFVDVGGIPNPDMVVPARSLFSSAKALGFGLKVHVDENTTPAFIEMALDSEAVSVDGIFAVDQAMARALSGTDTLTTLLGSDVLKSGTGPGPTGRLLIDTGAPVALATGFHPTIASTYSMQSVMSIACTRLGLTPEEAITAGTINGAHALRLSQIAGSLEYGKSADLLVLNISDYRDLPFLFGVNCVALTMRRGEIVYSESPVQCCAE